MSRALRYLPEGQLSSIEGYQARQARVAENVLLLPGAQVTFRRRAGRSAVFPEKV